MLSIFSRSLCFIVFLSCAARAAAQSIPSLSVQSLVAGALANNSEIAFYEARIAMAKGERLDAGRQPNPELSVQMGRWSVSGAGDGPAWQAAVSQTFEWPGRLNLRKAIADGQIEMAQLGLTSFRNSLAARVRAQAVGMMNSQEKVLAAEAAATRIRNVVAVLVQRDPSGPAPLLETRILEASMLTISREAALAKQNLSAARVELNLLRGARPETEFTVVNSQPALPAPPSLNSLLTAARTNNFDLRMRILELKQQGFAVNLAHNERGPAVTVQPYFSSQKAGGEKETTAGLSISVPLPLRSRNKGSIAAAEARLQQATASMEITLREVEKQIVTKLKAYEAQAAEMAQWRDDSLARFREAAEQGDRHYQLGAIPVGTYIELQKSYLEALAALLDTRSEALASLLELELLTGLPHGGAATGPAK